MPISQHGTNKLVLGEHICLSGVIEGDNYKKIGIIKVKEIKDKQDNNKFPDYKGVIIINGMQFYVSLWKEKIVVKRGFK